MTEESAWGFRSAEVGGVYLSEHSGGNYCPPCPEVLLSAAGSAITREQAGVIAELLQTYATTGRLPMPH